MNETMIDRINAVKRFVRKTEDMAMADKLDKNELVTRLQLAGIMLDGLAYKYENEGKPKQGKENPESSESIHASMLGDTTIPDSLFESQSSNIDGLFDE